MNTQQLLSNDKLASLTIKTLYRLMIKSVRVYPSVNRFDIYKEIKESFRRNRDLDNAKLIAVEKKKAMMGLAHMLMYNEKSDELMTLRYNTKTEYAPLNPKDENFIYF